MNQKEFDSYMLGVAKLLGEEYIVLQKSIKYVILLLNNPIHIINCKLINEDLLIKANTGYFHTRAYPRIDGREIKQLINPELYQAAYYIHEVKNKIVE